MMPLDAPRAVANLLSNELAKKVAVRSTHSARRFPSEQKATQLEVLSSLVSLLSVAVRFFPEMHYDVWKAARGSFGKAAKKERVRRNGLDATSAEYVDRPLLWSFAGEGPAEGGGQRYVFLQRHVGMLDAVWTTPRSVGSGLRRRMESLDAKARRLQEEANARPGYVPEPWPFLSAEVEPDFALPAAVSVRSGNSVVQKKSFIKMAESTENVSVVWAFSLSGRQGKISSCPKNVTLSSLSTLLGLGQIAVIWHEKVYIDHGDRPLKDILQEEKSERTEVNIDVVVVGDSWPNHVKTMRWKDVRLSLHNSQREMLFALIALQEGPSEEAGVRGRARIHTEVDYVVDGTFLFVELTRNFDVWLCYMGNLMIDGVATEARSVWLHADLHTPLQPVEAGCEFTMPIGAAQYTQVHLRIEIDAPPKLARPFQVAFDADVALMRSEPRRTVAQGDHVSSQGWTLSHGIVACSSFEPSFLRARIDVLKGDTFSSPAPASYDYMLATDEPESNITAIFEGRNGFDFRETCSWHSSCDVYRGLTIRKCSTPPTNFEPWQFVLCARHTLSTLPS